MNVSFRVGETINGYTIIAKIGTGSYTIENDTYRLNINTQAGEGKNIAKVTYAYDKKKDVILYTNKDKLKFIPIAETFANHLYGLYRSENNL